MMVSMFPGQGSQTLGMGEALFPLFPELVSQADAILGYSIRELCLKDEARLNQTQFTQPALFVVNALTYLKRKSEGLNPNYVLGHSLGEYNAFFAAEAFDFETGLKLVKKRGELMSQAQGGGMAAIIGLKAEEIESILHEVNLPNLSIANFNSYTQTVITGDKTSVEQSRSIFENKKALFFPLNVSGAFHSALMQSAQQAFADFIDSFKFNIPKIPIITNVTAQPIDENSLSQNLVQQIASPVKWVQSIAWLLEKNETEFEELGPKNVLTGLVQKIKKGK